MEKAAAVSGLAIAGELKEKYPKMQRVGGNGNMLTARKHFRGRD